MEKKINDLEKIIKGMEMLNSRQADEIKKQDMLINHIYMMLYNYLEKDIKNDS